MTRGKLELKTIKNPERRRITFCKRKAGLLKKASELALLCDAEVAVLIFSPSGKLFEFGSPSMNRIMEKYQKFSGSIRHETPLSDTIEMLRLELENLRMRMINLRKNYKHMIGEDLDSLSFKELKHLENKINLGGRKLRLRKDKILLEYIGSSKSKVGSLEVENANLGKKICRSYKPGDTNIEIVEGDRDKVGKDSGTQQADLLQTNLSLT